MKPKDFHDILEITTEELNYSKSVINIVADHFWSSVRVDISSLDYNKISIPEVGIFSVRYKRILKLKADLERLIDAYNDKDLNFNDFKMHTHNVKKLEKVNKLIIMMQEERDRKLEIHKKRRDAAK